MQTQPPSEPLVCVAVVATAHGLRGALKLRCFTERPENVAAYGPVYDKAGRKLFRLRLIRTQGETAIAAAEGVSDRNAAEGLRGRELYVPRAALPAPEEDEFYHEDLIGLPVRSVNGEELGTVRAVFDFGAGDVLEVRQASGGTLFLPFTRAVVPSVDLEAGLVIVDPPAEAVE